MASDPYAPRNPLELMPRFAQASMYWSTSSPFAQDQHQMRRATIPVHNAGGAYHQMLNGPLRGGGRTLGAVPNAGISPTFNRRRSNDNEFQNLLRAGSTAQRFAGAAVAGVQASRDYTKAYNEYEDQRKNVQEHADLAHGIKMDNWYKDMNAANAALKTAIKGFPTPNPTAAPVGGTGARPTPPINRVGHPSGGTPSPSSGGLSGPFPTPAGAPVASPSTPVSGSSTPAGAPIPPWKGASNPTPLQPPPGMTSLQAAQAAQGPELDAPEGPTGWLDASRRAMPTMSTAGPAQVAPGKTTTDEGTGTPAKKAAAKKSTPVKKAAAKKAQPNNGK